MKSTSNHTANELNMAISSHEAKQNRENMQTTQLNSIDSDEIVVIIYDNTSKHTIASSTQSSEFEIQELQEEPNSISIEIIAEIPDDNMENEIISEDEENTSFLGGSFKFYYIIPNKTAILFIEYQNDFVHKDGKLYGAVEPELKRQNMLSKSKQLLDYARERKFIIIHAPIFYCADYEKNANRYGVLYNVATNNAFGYKNPGADFLPSMEPFEHEPNEFIVKGKHGLDTFAGTDLDDILQSQNIANLAICGLLTNCCVESTMRTGYEYGYNILTIHDCCAATSQEEHENSVKHTFQMFSIPVTYEQFKNASSIEAINSNKRKELPPSSVMHSRQKFEYLKLTTDIAESMISRIVSLVVIIQLLISLTDTNVGNFGNNDIGLEILFLFIITIGDIISTLLSFIMWCYCHDRSKFENEDSCLSNKYRIQRAAKLRFVFGKFGQSISVVDVLKIIIRVSVGIKSVAEPGHRSMMSSLIFTFISGMLELIHIIYITVTKM